MTQGGYVAILRNQMVVYDIIKKMIEKSKGKKEVNAISLGGKSIKIGHDTIPSSPSGLTGKELMKRLKLAASSGIFEFLDDRRSSDQNGRPTRI